MEKSKQLPFKEPPFCTYQYMAGTGVTALQNPTAYNHYLNQCMILTCGRGFLTGYTSPSLSINGAALENLSFIERANVRRSFIDGCELQVVRNMIDEGYYICFNVVDVYYIKGMLWSGEQHQLHDGLICGYDDHDHTLTLAAYNSRWVYDYFKTPQEGFVKALASAKEKGGYDGFIGIKATDEKIALDFTAMADLLEDYLTPDPFGRSFEGPDPVRGIAVHDYLRLYLTFLTENEIPYERMDRRIMRLLWEQKRCMADRIAAAEKQFGSHSDLSVRYSPVLKSADKVRALYAGYRMKRRDELLVTVMKEIDKIKAIEEAVLPDFLKLLRGHKKYE